MSHLPHTTQPSNDINYDPVPGQEHHAQDVSFGEPPSPGPGTPGGYSPAFHTPNQDPMHLPESSFDLPLGAAQPQPRFLGAALYDDGSPRIRDSYASSHNTLGYSGGSEANSSVYALNYGGSTTPNQRDSFAGTYRDDPRSSSQYGEQVPIGSLSQSHGQYLGDKRATYAPPRAKSKRKVMILAVIGCIILLIIAIVVPLYFAVFKKKGGGANGDSSATPGASPSGSTNPKGAVVTGGDGSKYKLEDGSDFTYSNSFGGYWYWDETDPFNNGAKAQSWTPALNETFKFGVDRIRGVNIGGWLTLEPFITPALYEQYLNNPNPPVDEWTLSQAMAADTASGGLAKQLENHYNTFITEQDFAEIAGAGLNFVRIPLPYWAIEVRDKEPFLPKTSWTYFLKAIKWARKYGLRINLDFHALPGSQNGWNHSGKLGTVNMLFGPMGLANAQRSLDYIRVIAEFISQPQYKDVVAIFGVTNEPQGPTVGQENLQRYYLEAYNLVRAASGIGQGNGPMISLHDGFLGQTKWAGFLPNSDRVSMDIHPYLAFGGQSDATMDTYTNTPCSVWGESMNASMSAFGLNAAGEWSNAVTDCGLWVNGVNLGTRYEGNYTQPSDRIGSCEPWTNWQSWDATMKGNMQKFAESSMDALQNWFFWTWKIGNSSISGSVESPAWSYKLGLENGWMPKDPRDANGACKNANPWKGPLAAWQTGGSGAGQIPASATGSYTWPPTMISSGGDATALPTYTSTGPIPTLPAPTFSLTGSSSATKSIDVGKGWANPSDTAGGMVAVSGCSYLDPWVGPSAAPPSPLCGGGNAKRAPEPMITAPPLA